MSKKLIDADAFKKSVLTDFWEHYTQCHDTDQTSLMDMVMDNLDEQPTIDAVEVVRCRDCKHLLKGLSVGKYHSCMRLRIPQRVNLDDFCSFGEREIGDNND